MKFIFQFGILLGFWILGEAIGLLIRPLIVIPGSILGMILLFIALTSGVLKEKHIKDISDFLLTNIAFFFVPASVGIMALKGLSSDVLVPLVIIALVSTFTTMAGTMLITQLLTREKEDRK